jgi:hypothetical protein
MTQPTNGTEMASLVIGGLRDYLSGSQPRVFTSLDTATEKGRAMTMVFMQTGAAQPLADNTDVVLNVQDFIVHRVNYVDKDGVEQEGDRVILIQPDGKAFAAVSNGIRNSLGMLLAVFGSPPWKPARKVKCVAVKTRRSFTTLTLMPVLDDETPLEVKPPQEVKPSQTQERAASKR